MSKAVARRFPMLNTVTFPRTLREAIPEHELSAGRVLKLESVDAQGAHTVEWGRRVQVKMQTCETGKLTGVFDVWVDMDIEAARALAMLIQGAVEQSGKMPAVRAWPRGAVPISRKRK